MGVQTKSSAKSRKALSSTSDGFMSLPLSQVLDMERTPVVVLDGGLVIVYCNPAYESVTGKSAQSLVGQHVFKAFPESPERMEGVRRAFQKALGGTTSELEAIPYQVDMGAGEPVMRYWQTIQEPLRDRSGRVKWILQRALDVTEKVRTQNRAELVAKELDHRVKNILTVIQAMTRLTRHTDGMSKDEFAEELTGRISAMSRLHSRLYANSFAGIDLKDLLRDEFAAISPSSGFSLDGPAIRIGTNTARDLSMVVHEMATNAAKHGCFSRQQGHLNLSWKRTDAGFVLNWVESGCGKDRPRFSSRIRLDALATGQNHKGRALGRR